VSLVQGRFVHAGVSGMVIVGIGIALDGLGLLWMQRLQHRCL
jgi:hypothetical protein